MPSGSQLPLELYNEIINYLWDDMNALSACSLAGRIMTAASQKLVFYQIIIKPPRIGETRDCLIEVGGSSEAFYNLLKTSPHIAEYVQCLQIFNFHEAVEKYYQYDSTSNSSNSTSISSDPTSDDSDPASNDSNPASNDSDPAIDGSDSTSNDSDSSSSPNSDYEEPPLVTVYPLGDGWFDEDPFLPLYSHLLQNLKSFSLFNVPDWGVLCDQVQYSLQDLIRLPSLVHIDLAACPTILLQQSFSNNIKHLVIREEGPPTTIISPDPPNQPPIYLETLYMSKAEPTFLIPLTSDPDFRFKTSHLRKLLLELETDEIFQHVGIEPLLHSCRQTLEELIFMPFIDYMSETDVSAPRSTFIDLSQMMALKKLTLYFNTTDQYGNKWDPLWCLNNLLQSSSSTCPQLESIMVVMELYGRKFTDRYWNEICDFLVASDPRRCPCLKALAIHTLDYGYRQAWPFLSAMENSKSTERLRARDIELAFVGEAYLNIWTFAPDQRWENVAFFPKEALLP